MPAMSIPIGNRYRTPVPMPVPLEEAGLHMPQHDVEPDMTPQRPDMPPTPRTLQ